MVLNALMKGLLWSVLWIVYVYMLLRWFPWEMVHEYPDDIKEKTTLKQPSEAENKKGKLIGGIYSIALFVILAVFPILYFKGSSCTFGKVFLYTWIVAFTWNVIDLIVMDWLIVCTWTPDWIVLPGTRGCKGYKDYGFHFKGFLLGCIYISLTALIMAAVAYGVLKYFIH